MTAIALVEVGQGYYTGYGEECKAYRPTTAVSMPLNITRSFPSEMSFFVSKPLPLSTPLDWISLSRQVLPNAKPLTTEDRASVNEFFWSHFE